MCGKPPQIKSPILFFSEEGVSAKSKNFAVGIDFVILGGLLSAGTKWIFPSCGPLAAAYSAWRISRTDASLTLREVE